MTNQGDLPGSFFVAIISGGDVGSFRLLHEDCTGIPIGPSATCTAQVRFQPDSAGAKAATFTLVGDQGQPFQMNLTGDGVDPQASLTPDAYDFGRQAVGSSSAGQRFELSNDGATPMRLSGASIVGADADQFRLSADDCTDVTLPAGGRCAVQVRFAPDAKGARSARLRITGDDGSHTASLSGVGANGPGVSFRWREALRPHGKALVAGLAACKSSSSCRLRARGVLSGMVKRGAAVRHLKVKLPAVRLTIGAGKTRSLRLRLPGRRAPCRQGRRPPAAQARLERRRPARPQPLGPRAQRLGPQGSVQAQLAQRLLGGGCESNRKASPSRISIVLMNCIVVSMPCRPVPSKRIRMAIPSRALDDPLRDHLDLRSRARGSPPTSAASPPCRS